MEDDLVCEYDSTWETESDGEEAEPVNTARRQGPDRQSRRTKSGFWSNSSSRNLRAAKDMQNYRHGYPNMLDEDCPEDRMTNLKFYLNEIKSSPDDVSIETFHSEWRTDYKRLERVHSYIQWLFPLREPGVNYMATELTKKEIQAFRESEEAKTRLVDSYKLMLGFYGILLTDRETGAVTRADNWRERFANLERNMHNNLRITRILKSLGELGFEHFQAPLVRFFLEETLVKKNLSSVKRSVLDYFLFAVRDKHERRDLLNFAFQHFEPKDKFVWCPRRIQKRFKKKVEKRPESPGRTRENERDTKNEDTPTSDLHKGTGCKGLSVDPDHDHDDRAVPFEGASVDPESQDVPSEGAAVDLDSEAVPSEGSAVDPDNEEMSEYRNSTYGASAVTSSGPAENGAVSDSAQMDSDENSTEPCDQAPEPSERQKGPGSGREVVLSPKHVLASSPLPERAEKLPRTEAHVSVTSSDHELASGDDDANAANIAAMKSDSVTAKSENPEPMDAEVTAGGN